MEEGKHYFRLGLFVVVSLSVFAVALFLLGGRTLFQPTFTFETYFNESVAGLDIGAPVRFRGVPLGQVTEILTSSAIYEKDLPLGKRREYIVVRAKINLSTEEVEQLKRETPQLVQKGLRAQTQLVGVTGQQYLGLEIFDPGKYPPLQFRWTPAYTYIPSAPSTTGAIIANMQTLMASLGAVDVKALGQNLNTLVTDLDKTLNDAKVAELSANANAALERVDRILAEGHIDQTLRKLNSASTRIDALLSDPALKQSVDNVAAISERARKIAEDGELDRTIKRIDETAGRLDSLIGDNQYDARVIVQDLRVTASNLRTLSETIKRYPAGALVGGPPEKVQLPGSSR